MCGRIKREKTRDLVNEYGFVEFAEVPRYNIGPRQFVEVLAKGPGGLEFAKMEWGLHRSASMFNARAETLMEKTAFAPLLDSHRCAVPCDGFYEWDRQLDQPYLFALKDDKPFALAGLWEPHSRSFTVITTTPNELVAPFHDRMPVMLDGTATTEWLNGGDPGKLLKPFPAERMKKTAVSKYVNSVKHEGPECARALSGPASLFDVA